MLKIELLRDELLQESLDKMISGMLPHENYKSEYFGEILNKVLELIHLEEMEMEYYVIFAILTELRKISVNMIDYTPVLSRDNLDRTLEGQLKDLVMNPYIGIRAWLASEGHPDNLEIETTLELAAQKLYERTMDLYDKCMEMQVGGEEALSSFIALKSAFINAVAEGSMNAQREILNHSLRVGRKVYQGPEDWVEFITTTQIELKGRINDQDDSVIHINAPDVAKQLLDQVRQAFVPIGKYGIPPLDDGTPLLRHRLVTIAANENVGKTAVSINLANEVNLANNKVLFMCGESQMGLNYARALSNFIYHKYGMYVTTNHILGRDKIDDDIANLIPLAQTELYTSGNFILRNVYSYENFYDEVKADYEKYKMDMVVIDHSLALKGRGTPFDKVGMLAEQAREVKRDFPVCVLVLSHLSTVAKELVSKGKLVDSAPTKANASLAAESDEILVLWNNNDLKKQGKIALQVYKRRDAPPIPDVIILKTRFNVMSYEYDPRDQGGVDAETIGAEAALRQIAEDYMDGDGEEDEYSWNDEIEEDDNEIILS